MRSCLSDSSVLIYCSCSLAFSLMRVNSPSIDFTFSFSSDILFFNTSFIFVKILMSKISSIISLRCARGNCIKGVKEALPNTTICVNDL